MSRRRDRIPMPVTLALPAEPPSKDEVDAILIAADGIAGQVGRSGLTLILAGSRSKRVLEKDWDQLEGYGALSHLTNEVIGTKVDWCIHRGWLRIEYEDGLPLLYLSEKGWGRVQKVTVERLLAQFEEWAANRDLWLQVWPRLENVHRTIKLQLLDRIVEEERRDLAPVLAVWFRFEVRKMRAAINDTLEHLGFVRLSHPKDHPVTPGQ